MGIRRSAPDCGAGDAIGQRLVELGMTCATGLGTSDLVAAHMFFNLAVAQRNERAMALRQEIAGEMSREQIAAAQRAARDYLAAPPAGDRTFSEMSKAVGTGLRMVGGRPLSETEPAFAAARAAANGVKRLAVSN